MKNIQRLPEISTLHGLFAQARAEPSVITLVKGWTRLTTNDHGEMHGEPLQGFFFAETQMISHYEMKVNGKHVKHRLAVQLAADQWSSTGAILGSGDSGNLPEGALPKGAIEVRVLRKVDQGWTEWVLIKNNGIPARKIEFELSLVSPMHDSEFEEEMKHEQRLPPKGLSASLINEKEQIGFRFVRPFGTRKRSPTLEFQKIYGNRAPQEGQEVKRGLEIRVKPRGAHPRTSFQLRSGPVNVLKASTELGAKQDLCLEISYQPMANGQKFDAPKLEGLEPLPYEKSEVPPDALHVMTSNSTLNLVVGQAMVDLRSLKLPVFGDTSHRLESLDAFIAGVPRYIGLFGRDNLITAWQSALFEMENFESVLSRLAALQGVRREAWRDEEMDRLPHERRINPKAEVGESNRELYYGDVTSTPFWVLALSSLYQWTGDPEIVRRHEQTLRNCVSWILSRLKKGHGFIYYAPTIPDLQYENRNQAWKDSGDAIVDEEGKIQIPPLAVIEVQAYAYQALNEAAELLHQISGDGDTERLRTEADALKRRFNQAFWVADGMYYALALNRYGKPVASKASNVGHCLTTGILDLDKVSFIVRDLMADEFFSGWGIRTLSSKNPAYDPYSYHRGSVWPVENAFIANGLEAHGYIQEVWRVTSAQLSLAATFQHMRLPEVISGHPRSEDSPVPGIYSYSNLLQAWSVSAIAQHLQTLLGLRPRADRGTLYLNPHLPDWLSWIELKNLRVGRARLHLRFWRDNRGQSHWRVLNRQGGALMVRQGRAPAFGRNRDEQPQFPMQSKAAS
jgi:glycogen debranching enzyme